jgi:hypothetical protein
MAADQAIALSLFKRIDDAAEKRSHAYLVQFCENFFLQFFRHEFGMTITGVNLTSKKLAARRRIQLKSASAKAKATRALCAQFEQLCDNWPAVKEIEYLGDPSDLTDFHTEYMVKLLSTIVDWAKASGNKLLAERAGEAFSTYCETLDYWLGT